MEIIINILFTSFVCISGAVMSAYILLPFIYGIPRALVLVFKGFVKPTCLFHYLISASIGLLIVYATWYYFPSFVVHPGIKVGLVLFILRTVFSNSQRLDMKEDFIQFISHYLINIT